jgi:hypothetical protein
VRGCKILLLAMALLAVGGCTKQFLTAPELTLTERRDLVVAPPLAIAVIDSQATERNGDFATQTSAAIRKAYGNAVEIVPGDFARTEGRVLVRIRIRQLGAFFNQVLPPDKLTSAIQGNVADWAAVVAASGATDVLASGTVFKYLNGNWSGIAFLEVELRDWRPNRGAAFVMPLVAERVTPNRGGYFGAMMIAAEAWDQVNPRLTRFLDAAMQKLASEQ